LAILNELEAICSPVLEQSTSSFSSGLHVSILERGVELLSPHTTAAIDFLQVLLLLNQSISHEVVDQERVFVLALEFLFAENAD